MQNKPIGIIAAQFGAIACEMEGAAIAHVCYLNCTPCCVMRAISDGGDEGAALDYARFVVAAAKRALVVLSDFLSQLAGMSPVT